MAHPLVSTLLKFPEPEGSLLPEPVLRRDAALDSVLDPLRMWALGPTFISPESRLQIWKPKEVGHRIRGEQRVEVEDGRLHQKHPGGEQRFAETESEESRLKREAHEAALRSEASALGEVLSGTEDAELLDLQINPNGQVQTDGDVGPLNGEEPQTEIQTEELPADEVAVVQAEGGTVGLYEPAPGGFSLPTLESLGIFPQTAPPDLLVQARELLLSTKQEDDGQLATFLENRKAEIAQIPGKAEILELQVRATADGAAQAMQAMCAAQQQAVATVIAQQKAQVLASAQAQRTAIATQAATTMAAVESATRGGKASLLAGYQVLLARIAAAEAGQRATILGIYASTDRAYRAAGVTVGAKAIAEGSRRASGWRRQKINRDDSLLDGALTDNRLEARAEAAEKVSKKYQEEIIAAANKQADGAKQNGTKDLDVVAKAAAAARTQAKQLYDGMLAQIEKANVDSRAAVTQAAAGLTTAVNQTSAASIAALDRHGQTQKEGLSQATQSEVAKLQNMANLSIAGLRQGLADAAASMTTSLNNLEAQLEGVPAPDPEALAAALADAGATFSAQFTAMTDAFGGGANTAVAGIQQQLVGVSTGLQSHAMAAANAAGQMGAKALEHLGLVGAKSKEIFPKLSTGHQKGVNYSVEGAQKGFGQVQEGLTKCYSELGKMLKDGSDANVRSLTDGLNGALAGMSAKITEEADKAAAEVQPRWKSVLKWVLIIVLVIVIAVVLGPLVVGAVTGAAAALGASAAAAGVIGAVVGGAIVGALSGGDTTLIGNVCDGKPWNEGLIKAVLLGALGGAIGGGVGALVGKLTPLAQFSIKVATDVSFDTTVQLISGTFTWDGFLLTLVSSVITNGAENIKGIKKIQTDIQDGAKIKLGGVETGTPDVNVKAGVDGGEGTVKTGADGGEVTAKTGTDGPETTVKPTTDSPETTVKATTDAPETVLPKTGVEQAKHLGWPEAPEGYVWVKRESGKPYLRRAPGGKDLPKFKYDEAKGAFVDTDTGLTLKTTAEVEAVIKVKATEKGVRPEPEAYLSKEHIDAHLKLFEEGAAYLVPKKMLDKFGREPVGRKIGQFVMTKAEMDSLLAKAGGDIAKIEKALGIPPGAWAGETLVRIDVKAPKEHNLRLPSGNEAGANELWIPGGKLPTGQAEAVVDNLIKGSFVETIVAGP